VTFKVAIGTFGEDDSADIKVDGRVVGWLERVKSERFASATSRARIAFVSHYSIMLTDDAANDQLKKHDVDTRAEAKLEITRAFESAWVELSTKGATAGAAQPWECERCGYRHSGCTPSECLNTVAKTKKAPRTSVAQSEREQEIEKLLAHFNYHDNRLIRGVGNDKDPVERDRYAQLLRELRATPIAPTPKGK
jgi:hypothetical protein